MPLIDGVEKSYGDLTDDEIDALAYERWDALPYNERTSVKSIEISEDIRILRDMDLHARSIQTPSGIDTPLENDWWYCTHCQTKYKGHGTHTCNK
jgi:hypothetical protein